MAPNMLGRGDLVGSLAKIARFGGTSASRVQCASRSSWIEETIGEGGNIAGDRPSRKAVFPQAYRGESASTAAGTILA